MKIYEDGITEVFVKSEPPSVAPVSGERLSATQKVFAVMECIATSERPLTVSDLAILLDVPKASMHRIVHQLDTDGLLMPDAGSRGYVPGPRLLNFGLNVVNAGMRNAPRHAVLQRVSAETGETVNFGLISGGSIVYVDRVEAAWPFGLRYEIGSRVPAYCTSMGKLLLAHMPKRRRDHFLSVTHLHPYTPHTMTDPAQLEEQFAEIRSQGYSLDNQEFLAGVVCVAVPVHDARGQVCSAIAASAPLARMSVEKAIGHVHLLTRAAKEISQSWSPDPSDDPESTSADKED